MNAFAIGDIGASQATQNPLIISNGLVEYWSFQENTSTIVRDFVGGKKGTFVNSPTWVNGRKGRALQFNGTNDRIDIAGSTVGDNFTIVMWIYPLSSALNYTTLYSNNAGYGFYLRAGGPAIQFYPADAYSTFFTNDAWHHIACVRKAGGGTDVTYYVDGATAGTAAGGQAFTANVIGSDSAGEAYKGIIDELRFYNRTLTAGEITTLYNG